MVYCRPHVCHLRKERPELSLTEVVWAVFKSGGDLERSGQSRRSSIGNGTTKSSGKALERIKRDHLQRMKKIREVKSFKSPETTVKQEKHSVVCENESEDEMDCSLSNESIEREIISAANTI